MVIIAGSYYDEDHFSRVVVIGGTWPPEQGYKIHPSRYEASPRAGLGMREGKYFLVMETKYGRFAVITCVDLLSDEVQYSIRQLATRGDIDLLININLNPAAWEFLIETNSLVRRHPIFASVTNSARLPGQLSPADHCGTKDKPIDNGRCFGHSSVFADLRQQAGDSPNNVQAVVGDLPADFVDGGALPLAYDHLAGDVGAFKEGLLIYELNLRMTREPLNTNAPDQGYPTIRAIRVSPL
jgi:predicted amidohydrolase